MTTAERARRRPDPGRRWLIAGALAVGLSGAGATAHADETAPPAVGLAADHADLDLEARTAALRGHVVVTAARATLQAERLELAYLDNDQIRVTGPADLTWCQTPRPPLSLRFDQATIGHDTVSARGVALRAFGKVPIAYLPWISLRGPTRWGLLPPAFALRAKDGARLSLGVHAPVASWLAFDVRPGVYLQTGAEVQGTMRTAGGDVDVRWDRTTSALFAARGAVSGRGAFAAEVDVLRGPRGRAGTTELEVVARPYDRAGVGVFSVGPSVAAGAVVRAAGRRVDGDLVYAPRLVLATGRTHGPFIGSGVGELGTFFDARGIGRPFARLDRDVTVADFAGPVRLRGTFRGAALVEGTDELRIHSFGVGLVDAGLPLARRFGSVRHVIDPGLGVSVVGGIGASTLPNGQSPEQRRGLSVVPAPRVATSFVGQTMRVAARAAAGTFIEQDAVRMVYRGGVVLDAKAAAVRVDAYGIGRRGHVGTVLLDAGDEDSATFYALVAARTGEDSLVARGLATDLPLALSSGSYSRVGVTESAGLRVPLGGGLALATRLDLDEAVVIGGLLGMGYVHPCGCLGASVVSSSRVGRGGNDTLFLVDLAPLPGSRALAHTRWN